jgi:homospermidine synthase
MAIALRSSATAMMMRERANRAWRAARASFVVAEFLGMTLHFLKSFQVNIAANVRLEKEQVEEFERSRTIMSVIGRLDSQVEEVLIAPIARRHEQQAKEREKAEQAQAEKTKTKKEEEQASDSE